MNRMPNKTFAPFPILTTARLTLRKLITNDYPVIFNLRSDTEINKFLDRKKAETPDDAKQFINMVNENTDKGISIYWAITLSSNRELVGTICLFCFSDEDEKCEIGYELLTNFQNKGIMQEAVEKVIDYAFNTIKVNRIEALFHRENHRSIKLLEKFSFKNSDKPDTCDAGLLSYYLKNPASGE